MDIPVYDFSRLDDFFSHLTAAELTPALEFMTTVKFKRKIEESYIWEDLAFQIVTRYIEQYGVKKVKNWKFETWNEPDLKGYNLRHFSMAGNF